MKGTNDQQPVEESSQVIEADGDIVGRQNINIMKDFKPR